MKKLPPEKSMLRAVAARDPAFEGVFFFAVKTTGIFCRPTCAAKPARPENIEFFATIDAARAAGYRPCKRCRPIDSTGEPPWALRLIAAVEQSPHVRVREKDLEKFGVDASTIRRYFQKRFGMTFQDWARARRLSDAFASIRDGKKFETAMKDGGYESESGFRDAFTRLFGATPLDARGGPDAIRLGWVTTPLGDMLAGANEAGVCLCEFTDRRGLESQLKTLRRRFSVPILPGRNRHLDRLDTELGEYFAGKRREFSVPIVAPGTPFQESVWRELSKIPYGTTASYEDLAKRVGRPGAVRAVGTANGKNRIAILLPCHRVVKKDGTLGGYAGGLARKERLLHIEVGDT